MLLTKKRKEILSKNLATLGGVAWGSEDIKVTKAICEICVACNLNVDKVFSCISSKTVKKKSEDLFIDASEPVKEKPKRKTKTTKKEDK